MVTLSLISFALCFVICIIFLRAKKIKGNVPTVSWSLPIVGHLPYFGSNPGIKFMQWKKIYGPIFAVNFASYPSIVLNDVKLIKEFLNHPVISGRPVLANFAQMAEHKGIMLVDGVRQAEQRKFVIKTFKKYGIGKSRLEFTLQEEIGKFIKKLKGENNTKGTGEVKIRHFFQFPVINSLWTVFMGKRFNEEDSTLGKFTEYMDQVTDNNSSILAQATWFFPWCSQLLSLIGLNPPVNGWQKIHKYLSNEIHRSRGDHVPGHPNHFTHDYFDQVDQTRDESSSFHSSRQEQPYTTTDIFSAAVDTTTTTMDWLLLYMAREPEVQRKLQQEIDNKSELFELSLTNRSEFPYTEALIYELLRVSSTTPLGLFRRTLEDVQIHGFNVPKDTMVIGNLYGVHHDPDVWPEPEKFHPERFLDEEGKLNKLSSELVPFGYGKRICIGEGLARDQLFVFITNFFKEFNVSSSDKNQLESINSNFGFVHFPDPYSVVISHRG